MSYNFKREDAIDFARAGRYETREKGDELEFEFCPYCRGGDHRDKWTFSINLVSGAFKCLRASCEEKGHFVQLCRDFDYQLEFDQDKAYKPLPQPKQKIIPTEAAARYLESRGISKAITDRYEVTTGSNPNILKFLFYDDTGQLVFIKYRKTDYQKGRDKNKEWCEKDTMPILFGMKQCTNYNRLVITEGQIDSLSVAEAGIENAVSVPTGATGFTWVNNCGDWVRRFDEIVVFGDYERGRITLVDGIREQFPDKRIRVVRKIDYLGEKDANDILRQFGDAAIRTAIENAEDLNPNYRPQDDDFSQAAVAEMFSEYSKGRILYTDSLGWLVWDGKRWAEDDHAAMAAVMKFAAGMRSQAKATYKQSLVINDDGKQIENRKDKEFLTFSCKLRNENNLRAILNLSKPYLHIEAKELDRNWYELNTPAGVVDLRTGEIKPHDPAALHTKITSCAPSDIGAELWQDTLNRISRNDRELQEFLQEKAGADAFGKVMLETAVFAVGDGRNGKSTYYNSLQLVLGDYAGTISSKVLTTERQNRGAEKATLRGKRFIVSGELEEGQKLSSATLKDLVSTDAMRIERKYKDPEDVQPTHSITLFSNFLPRVGSTDSGTWRRLLVIPFNAEMPAGNDEIPNYAEYLADHAGGAILKWIIEGAKRFCEHGYHLDIPNVVARESSQYRDRENWIRLFINECCIADPRYSVQSGKLYQRYKVYCSSTGEYCRRTNDFAAALMIEGYKTETRRGGKKFILGLDVDPGELYSGNPAAYNF